MHLERFSCLPFKIGLAERIKDQSGRPVAGNCHHEARGIAHSAKDSLLF